MARRFTAADSEFVTLSLGTTGITEPVAVAAVFRPATLAAGRYLFSDGASNGYAIGHTATQMFFGFGTTLASSTTLTNLIAGHWYFAFITHQAGAGAIEYWVYDYTAGTWSHSSNGTAFGVTPGGTRAQIGCNYAQNGGFFDGDIAELAVFQLATLGQSNAESMAADLTLANWRGQVSSPAQARAQWILPSDPSLAITDLTGHGANQSAIVGTTATVDDLALLELGPVDDSRVVSRTV